MPEDPTLLDELDEVHRLVVQQIKEDLEHEDPARRRLAIGNALQLLKQNSISASAMPKTPQAEMARMMGNIGNFTAITEKMKVRTVLQIPESSASPFSPGSVAHGDAIEAAALVEPKA